MKYLMKSKMAYVPLFRSKPFRADVRPKNASGLGMIGIKNTTSMDYYPVSVADFYDCLEYNDESRALSVVYGNT